MQREGLLLAASMACADFANLGQTVALLEKAGVDILHFDVCDGHFAPTFLLSPMIMRSLRPLTSLRFDVHLYCEYPSRYVDELGSCGADLVIIHVESKENYRDVVKEVRQRGMKAGVGILPESAVPGGIEDTLPDVSLFNANTVGRAYAGQTFDSRGLENIRQLSKIAQAGQRETGIAADGAVGFERLDSLLKAGANVLVLGTSCLFRPGQDLVEAVRVVRKRMAKAGLPGKEDADAP